MERHEAIVVGAGSAGLSAAAALQKRGFETIVLECSDAVGARWRSRYEELRLNSWRAMSNLQGYRMPRSYGRYPGRDDFVAYLERYATHQRLRVRFSTELVRVERAGDLWRLQTSTRAMLARYVVIATGWDAVAVLPDWPGRESFVPGLIHSSDFRGARGYRDREVLVVGAGNSGIDIAGHLIAAGAHVKVSMRTPPNLAQRELLGLPGQPLALLADHLPARLADSTFFLTQRMLFGDLSGFGVPRKARAASAAPDHLNHRPIRVRRQEPAAERSDANRPPGVPGNTRVQAACLPIPQSGRT
jgi:putative flavoprotein involved in K+ transport